MVFEVKAETRGGFFTWRKHLTARPKSPWDAHQDVNAQGFPGSFATSASDAFSKEPPQSRFEVPQRQGSEETRGAVPRESLGFWGCMIHAGSGDTLRFLQGCGDVVPGEGEDDWTVALCRRFRKHCSGDIPFAPPVPRLALGALLGTAHPPEPFSLPGALLEAATASKPCPTCEFLA